MQAIFTSPRCIKPFISPARPFLLVVVLHLPRLLPSFQVKLYKHMLSFFLSFSFILDRVACDVFSFSICCGAREGAVTCFFFFLPGQVTFDSHSFGRWVFCVASVFVCLFPPFLFAANRTMCSRIRTHRSVAHLPVLLCFADVFGRGDMQLQAHVAAEPHWISANQTNRPPIKWEACKSKKKRWLAGCCGTTREQNAFNVLWICL